MQPLIIQTVSSVSTTAITADGQGQQCEFDAKGPDSTGAITVQVIDGPQGIAAYSEATAGEAKPVSVPGVGDKATRDTEDGEVNALKGDLFCSVSYSSSDDVPGVGPLEEAHGATNNIGENYYDTIAEAMGTLCNRIYGSGNMTADLSSLLAADTTATPSDDGGLPECRHPPVPRRPADQAKEAPDGGPRSRLGLDHLTALILGCASTGGHGWSFSGAYHPDRNRRPNGQGSTRSCGRQRLAAIVQCELPPPRRRRQ